ncbi:AMP-binding protein [Rubrivirga sp. S365]|uniref:AMP-binding protein n=1 Tax=Rubrivirga sp. S365 TaxID=3076080 RepID=UPI0028CA7A3A|nr:AMP-binding protein [Rubrivirga sp. S365]MDT7856244.1 AMP-binding protein [Rubrivirga sp. S365]
MTDPVRHHACARPSAPALVTPDAVWTWAELDARVGACAARLAALPRAPDVWQGAAPLAVRAHTSPALVVLTLAALRAGRTLVPLSTRWLAAAVADALDRLGLDALVVDGSDGAPAGLDATPLDALVQAGRGGAEERGGVGEVAQSTVASSTTSLHATTLQGGGAGGVGAEAGRGGARASNPEPRTSHPPFTVVHTSGSTGVPKAALHTVGNHVASARGVNRRLGLGADGRWLLDLPLYHVGGLGVVVRCALEGAAMVLPGEGMSTAEAVRVLRPTHASFVSTQLRRLLDALGGAAGGAASLRAVLLGGSAIPASLLDEAAARGLPVATSYGLTEMTSTVTATAAGADRPALATSGDVLDGRALRVAASGEIEVGGAALFAGYLGPDGLAPPGAWFATGDLGHLDGAGRLVVTGRRGLLFVSGGENVQPEAIEAALLALDGVAEAVVVPVPDADFGHRPAAFVRTTSATPPDADGLRAALRRTLPGFMVPVAVYAWGGAGGMKPDRPALAERARGMGRDRGAEG